MEPAPEHPTPPPSDTAERTEPAEPTGHRRRARRRWRRDLVTRVAGDALDVRRAFGEPVRQGDVTLVPVAKVLGGSGSGWGTGEVGGDATARARGEGSGAGGGGGFGVRVRPVGVFVVRGSDVQWQPALDLSRVILGGQVVGAVALVALSVTLRAWSRRRCGGRGR